MQKITPCLWFNYNADEALEFYMSIFKNARVKDVSYYGKGGPAPEGAILVAVFELEGQEFMALNGGPLFHFTEAVSFYVKCDTQAELDNYWEKLSAGGQESQCGWLKDKFGLSWQIIPSILSKLISGKDQKKSNNVMQALMKMGKLDIQKLQEAYDEA